MKSVGVADLKNNLSRHLREVEIGATIQVTDHDRPVALLVPVEVKTNLNIRAARKPFAEVRDIVFPPLDLPFDPVAMLLEERRQP